MSTAHPNDGQPHSNLKVGLDLPPLEPIIALGMTNGSAGASHALNNSSGWPAYATTVVLASEHAAHGCCEDSMEESERWDGLS